MTVREWFEKNPAVKIKLGAKGGSGWVFFGDYDTFLKYQLELDRVAEANFHVAFKGSEIRIKRYTQALEKHKDDPRVLPETVGKIEASLERACKNEDSLYALYRKYQYDTSFLNREVVETSEAMIPPSEMMVLYDGADAGRYWLQEEWDSDHPQGK